jgi:hypothetical protein
MLIMVSGVRFQVSATAGNVQKSGHLNSGKLPLALSFKDVKPQKGSQVSPPFSLKPDTCNL